MEDEIFSEDKIYMPLPQQFGRSDKMGRGPYEKSGIINDTGLPPGKTVEEHFEILFPTEDVRKGKRVVSRTLEDNEMEVNVKLWYLPYGNKKTDPFLWKEFTKTLTVSK
jgi:hypothetical protein